MTITADIVTADVRKTQGPSFLGRLRTVVRVGSIRFSLMYFVAFYSALLGRRGGELDPFWIWAGIVLGASNCLAIELTNRWADRAQDLINCPERTALCETVGFRSLATIAALIYGLQIPLFIVWHFAAFNGQVLAVQIASWFVGWNYSVGLRLKRRRYGVLVVLTATFILPYLWGWTIGGGRLADVPVAILCVPAFVISLAGAKDLTDVKGDAVVGYRGAFVDLVRARSAMRLLLLLSAPYVFCSLVVLTHQAPPRLLYIWLLAPVSFAFVRMTRNASPDDAFAVRELMYHMKFAFVAVSMYLLYPYRSVALSIVGAAVGWLLATRFLHWHAGLRWRELRALVALLGVDRATAAANRV